MAGRPNNQAAIDRWKAGMRAAKKAFQALPDEVRDATLHARAVTAQEVVRGAQARVKASPSIVTGSLLNAIGWSQSKTNGRTIAGVRNVTSTVTLGVNFAAGRLKAKTVRVKGIVVAGRGGSALTSQGAKLIRPARYAHLVEFGTSKMPAEPFMRPAVAAERGPYLDRMKRIGPQVERNLAAIGSRTL